MSIGKAIGEEGLQGLENTRERGVTLIAATCRPVADVVFQGLRNADAIGGLAIRLAEANMVVELGAVDIVEAQAILDNGVTEALVVADEGGNSVELSSVTDFTFQELLLGCRSALVEAAPLVELGRLALLVSDVSMQGVEETVARVVRVPFAVGTGE